MCALVRYGALRTVSRGSGRESVSGRSSLEHHEPPRPRRSVLRYVLIALAVAIVVANVINQQSVAADDEPAPTPGSALERWRGSR